MRNYSANRRGFFYSMAGLAVSIPRLPFAIKKFLKTPFDDQDFVIVNGWVLTHGDFVASKVNQDVV